jgi:hypothetical protein
VAAAGEEYVDARMESETLDIDVVNTGRHDHLVWLDQAHAQFPS